MKKNVSAMKSKKGKAFLFFFTISIIIIIIIVIIIIKISGRNLNTIIFYTVLFFTIGVASVFKKQSYANLLHFPNHCYLSIKRADLANFIPSKTADKT